MSFTLEWFCSVTGFPYLEHVKDALLLNLNLPVSAKANVKLTFVFCTLRGVFQTLQRLFTVVSCAEV